MKMSILTLPDTTEVIAEYPYFPTRQQLFIWRNWGMVKTKTIAEVLGTDVETVNGLAADMGLDVPMKYNAEYAKRGFITIIRNNWQVVPYDQLIKCAGMTRDELAFTLKEDDFLGVKLQEKPNVSEIKYTPLTEEQKEQTKKLKAWTEKHFAEYRDKITVNDFDFIKDYGKPERKMKNNTNRAVVLDSSWGVKNESGNSAVDVFAENFVNDTEKEWGVKLCGTDKFITLKIEPDETKKQESHVVTFAKDGITVTAVDEEGVNKGLQYIAFIADRNDGLTFDEGTIVRDTQFDVRYTYSYNALYGDALLEGGVSSYPDELLKEYSRIGINGIWIHAVLYKLVEFPWEPSLSDKWQQRIKGLQSLVARAAKFGIKVYLYMNEPRAMPMSFFDKYPELLGYSNGPEGTLCTSTPEVQKYLSDSITQLCEAAPQLGGFFTITASENLTNCYAHVVETPCPRCSKRKAYEVLAEVNLIIARAARKVNKDIKVLAWNWGWTGRFDSWDDMAQAIGDEGARVMCTSEEGVKKTIGGVETSVIDYSISLVGPGENAKNIWKTCRKHGVKTLAKVQFNNTWECSTVPYLPVVDLVEQHIQGIVDNKVDGLMIGWTLGGYPSMNLEVASQYYWTNGNPQDAIVSIFGDKAPVINKATETFSKAFQNFPFHIGTLYKGPQHMGPSNPLFEHQTKLYATMTGLPYDDINQWRSIYPLDVFENQLRLVAEGFKKGIDELKASVTDKDLAENKRLAEFVDVATGTYCLFKSSYQQTAYNVTRNKFDEETDPAKKEEYRKRIIELLNAEMDTAMEMYKVMIHNSTIGYEAANHYFFNKYSMMEKILCCEYLLERFGK